MRVASPPVPTSSSELSAAAVAVSELDRSCRMPLLGLLSGAVLWLVVASVASLLASLSFHVPAMFADHGWLSHGRILPTAQSALAYGFCLQAGWAAALWMLVRLGRRKLSNGWLVAVGAKLCNIGIAVGLVGILLGDATGYELFELPAYSAVILFVGAVLICVSGLTTLQTRAEPGMYPSQWFAGLALLWFPWVYCTAVVFLLAFPLRGIAQATVHYWYSNQLQFVLFSLLGLGLLFYFVPKFRRSPLHGEPLALFALVTILVFGCWMGIPRHAPLPAWVGMISASATLFLSATAAAVAVNIFRTKVSPTGVTSAPEAGFFGFGFLAWLIWAVLTLVASVTAPQNLIEYTLAKTALFQLSVYGFAAMVVTGAVYHILPRITGIELPFPRLVRAHFVLAALGVVLIVVPLFLGGIRQGRGLGDASIAFVDVARGTLMPIRVSTTGELLIILGHLLLTVNLFGIVFRLGRAGCASFAREAGASPSIALEAKG